MAKNDAPYLGIDLGGTNIQGGIVSPSGKVLASDSTKTKADQGSDAVMGRIDKLVGSLLDKGKLKIGDVAGLGIGAPGTVDAAAGVVETAVNLRWTRFPLGETLSKQLKMPVVVDNDVNVGTWGEHAAGAGKGHDDLLGIFVGTGIGGGLVLGGRLYRGAMQTAGEIGHTVLAPGAALGRRTLENLASRTAMVNLLTQLIATNHPSAVPDLAGGDMSRIRSKVLAQAMRENDPLTRQVVGQAAEYVGIAIANTVTLLSLPCVVVGGGVTEALKQPWIDLIRASFEQHVFPADLKKCKIVASRLGDDAGVVGAALLAQRTLTANK